MHWIDNTSAIVALCKGYSAAPDSARILQACAVLRLNLDCPIWFQWVPSKANIADLPSRREYGLLRELGSVEVALVLPPFERWDTPFARWTPIVAEGESSDARRQRGSIAVGNLVARAREASDPSTWEVKVDRSSPLGNPFPMNPGQDRGVVCKAFESLVRKGLSVEEVAREFSPPLVFDASFASRGAEKARKLELERLAAFSAGGGSLRLMCWCAPRQCHALSIAKVVAERAESACRLLSQRES